MIIAKVDPAETVALQRHLKRNNSFKRRLTLPSSSVKFSGTDRSSTDFVSSSDLHVDISTSSDEWQRRIKTPPQNKRMRMALPALVSACEMHVVSDRAAASLATAELQDMQIIGQSNPRQVIDQSKVRRECYKQREDLTNDTTIALPGLYFDGRKNQTLVPDKMADGKFYRQIITEEHI